MINLRFRKVSQKNCYVLNSSSTTKTFFPFNALINIHFNCRYQKEEEERERDALMSRTFTANDSDTSIMIDAALQHNNAMYNAHRGVDDMLNSGSAILGNLREQRGTLKGAHKKILDVVNYLGLSNTVLRLVEKRAHQDKFVLYGGMVVCCIIMFLVWKYLT